MATIINSVITKYLPTLSLNKNQIEKENKFRSTLKTIN